MKKYCEVYFDSMGYPQIDKITPLSLQSILSAELKDGSLKGLRDELTIIIQTAPAYEDSARIVADAVIALLTKGEE